MNKNEFIERLTKKLHDNKVPDIEEVVSEYEAHFAFKLSDGYSEEEIAANLGKPEALAEQFALSKPDTKTGGKKAIAVTGLVFVDILVVSFFILLWGWVVVMGAFSISTITTGICLAGSCNIYSLIPHMPYWCAIIMSIAFIALSILTAAGTYYCASFTRQLMRAYGRFHHNCIAAASGTAVLPRVATYPQFSIKTHRRLRGIALISLAVFGATLVSGYIICMISAGAVEFWHEWNWFVK